MTYEGIGKLFAYTLITMVSRLVFNDQELSPSDLAELREEPYFRDKREVGISEPSWPYLIPSSSRENNNEDKPPTTIEVKYITPTLVAFDLNAKQRPFSQGKISFFNSNNTNYYGETDLYFNKVTGKFSKAHNADATDSDFEALARLSGSSYISILNEDSIIRNNYHPIVAEERQLIKKYENRLDIEYILDFIFHGYANNDLALPFKEYIESLMNADPLTKQLIQEFLLDAAPIYFNGNEDTLRNMNVEYTSESYIMLLKASGYQNDLFSDQRLENIDFSFALSGNTVPGEYTPEIWASIYDHGVPRQDEPLFPPGKLEQLSSFNKYKKNTEKAEAYAYAVARILMGENLPELSSNALLSELTQAVKSGNDLEVTIAVAKINDQVLVPLNYGLIIEKEGKTWYVAPVQIEEIFEKEVPLRQPDGSLKLMPVKVYCISNVFNSFKALAHYYLSQGLKEPPAVLDSHYNTAYQEYYARTGISDSFLGPKVLKEQYQNLDRSLYSNINSSPANDPIIPLWNKIKDKTESATVAMEIEYHEIAHLEGYMAYGVSEENAEIYAELRGLAESYEPTLVLYMFLKERFVTIDQSQKIHLKPLLNPKGRKIGYGIQQKHGFAQAYFFLRMADDASLWNGTPLLSEKESFISVYKKDPNRFDSIIRQLVDKLVSMSSDDIRGLAQSYAEELKTTP